MYRLCSVFDISRSSYYDYRNRKKRIDAARIRLRIKATEIFNQSRQSAGSRTIKIKMREAGEVIGRFKVRRLMKEASLVSKQPKPPAYKTAKVERPDIPNHLNREFEVTQPNQRWCGDITYVWSQGRWVYLAVVLDLYARRVVGWSLSGRPDAELVIAALDMYGLSITRESKWRDVSLGSRQSICQQTVSPTTLALPHEAKHEPSR